MKKFILINIIIHTLISCSGVLYNPNPPQSGKAIIYMFRPDAIFCYGFTDVVFHIASSQQKDYSLENNNYAWEPVNPGIHRISATENANNIKLRIGITAEAGKNYYIKWEDKCFLEKHNLSITSVPEEEALTLISQTHYYNGE